MDKMWGGRFTADVNKIAEEFNASISFDKRLVNEDIIGSIAHAKMLGKQGIISLQESEEIVNGLLSILDDAEKGLIEFSEHDEDIHMNVERILTERIGPVGKKLHTGRSRNDQVALDIRIYLKNEIAKDISCIKDLISTIRDIASENIDTIIPVYTHMQKAQPSTLAHYLLAYAEMFIRDIERLKDCLKRTNKMPLGSGALCSTTYPLDRDYVAGELDFDSVTNNSIDGVSDRDFAMEYLSDASICMVHLSRFCEELILYSTNEFSTVNISDAFSTGSSIMPQKKNPDMAELIRGKTGRVFGDLIAMLTIMKALPLAYNKDMQEDKEQIFDACDTLSKCLIVFNEMLKTTEWDKDKLYKSAALGFTNATDAADYLTKKGLPFRDAHSVVGKMVLYCEENKIGLTEMPIEKFREFSNLFDEDIYDCIDIKTCVENRSVYGGPSESSIKEQLIRLDKKLKD